MKRIFIIISLVVGVFSLSIFVFAVFENIKRFKEIQALQNEIYVPKADSLLLLNLKTSKEEHFDLKRDSLFLHFWATWCKPCIKELPLLDSLIANNRKFNYYFISNEETEVIRNFLASNGYKNIDFYKIDKDNNIFDSEILPVTYYKGDEDSFKRITGKNNWRMFFNKQ